jgi:hypothetical protein
MKHRKGVEDARRGADVPRMRRIALVALLLLLVASPAAAHEGEVTHVDTARDLQDVDIAGVARTAQRQAAPGVAAAEEALPLTWCGDETSANDTAHAAPLGAHQIHVVYARATGQLDNFNAWKDRLQANVSVVQRFLASQSGGAKALRFDMGTRCGPEYVDITSVALPSDVTADDLDAVDAATRDALGPGFPSGYNLLIVTDGLTSNPGGWLSGVAWLVSDDRPGSSNESNLGGLTAVLWAPAGSPGNWRGTGWWPEGFLHEITHNLGGVQAGAPDATAYGHCTDETDVMCYQDGPGTILEDVCPEVTGAIAEIYDCGKDDYFAPAPPAGSYLATHWNVYNSAFMTPCSELGTACGGAGGPIPTPPVNDVPPLASGTTHVGGTLTASQGVWRNTPTRYRYRWQRGTSFGWGDIAGATSDAYRPTGDDVGLRLRVLVTAKNADGTVVAASAPTDVIGPLSPATPAAPVVVTPRVRKLTSGTAWLTVTAGSPRGRRLARVAFAAPTAGRVTTAAVRIKRRSGRYVVQLCTTGSLPTCVAKKLRARAGRLAIPALSLRVGGGQRVRVALSVTALSRRAKAVTRGPLPLDV